MSYRVLNLKEARSALKSALERKATVASDEHDRIIEQTAEAAQREAPYQTGALANSGVVRKRTSPTGVEAFIEFGGPAAPYAPEVHARDPFLTRATNQVAGDRATRIGRRLSDT